MQVGSQATVLVTGKQACEAVVLDVINEIHRHTHPGVGHTQATTDECCTHWGVLDTPMAVLDTAIPVLDTH